MELRAEGLCARLPPVCWQCWLCGWAVWRGGVVRAAPGYDAYYRGIDDGHGRGFGDMTVPPATPSRPRGNDMISSSATAPTILMCRMGRWTPLTTKDKEEASYSCLITEEEMDQHTMSQFWDVPVSITSKTSKTLKIKIIPTFVVYYDNHMSLTSSFLYLWPISCFIVWKTSLQGPYTGRTTVNFEKR